MKSFNSIRIATKLPIIVMLLCLVASSTIAVLGYRDFQRTILNESYKSFEILTQERRAALTSWIDGMGQDVVAFGENPHVMEAVAGFSTTFHLLTDNPEQSLQAAYIFNNPNPAGERDRLQQAPEAIPYNFKHGEFHPFFRQIKDKDGYYDIFLFNMDGDLIYSVYKEADFATNFSTGPYRETGLGRAFKAARDGSTGELYFADFSNYEPSAGAPAAFLATPVAGQNGAPIGVFAIQIPANELNRIISNPIGLGETGELYIVGPDGQTRSVSRFDGRFDMLQSLSLTPQVNAALTDEVGLFDGVVGLNGNLVIAKTLALDVLGNRWGMIGEIDVDEVMKPVVSDRNKMIIFSLLGTGLAALFGWFTARTVTIPLERLGSAMQAVSDRDYEREICDTERHDEIGTLANVLVAFRDKLQASDTAEQEREKLQKEQQKVVERLSIALTKLADGDLTRVINTPFISDYDQLRLDYNRIIQNLNKTIGSVVSSASNIKQRSNEMSGSSDELSRRTENQAATLEETAAALDELTASVKSAASGSKEIEKIVSDARQDADESGPVVRNAVAAMTEIEKSSDEISQIIGVIDDIAFQTNLLALNAGVEAARAGDAGRGFAVVASEVRALAQRSSDAAKQIKTLISGSSQQVERGVSLVGQAGEVLTKIVDRIAHISSLMTEIASGAQEQSIGLGEINIGVTQLDKVTQQNAAMVEEATAGSHALNQQAAQLADLVARFQLMQSGHQHTTDDRTAGNNIAVFSSAQTTRRRTLGAQEQEINPTIAATGTDGDAISTNRDVWKDF